ncbi:MAG: hypothetical protein WD042_16410 [Phycisphaeraceae bacterium]
MRHFYLIFAAVFMLLAGASLRAQDDVTAPPLQPAQEPAARTEDAAGAEDAAKPGVASIPRIDLDLKTLLDTAELLPATVDDTIWLIEPTINRKLVQIPFIVEPGSEPVAADNNTLKLRGGRFLAWRLDREAAPKPKREEPAAVAAPQRPGVVALPSIEAPPPSSSSPAANLSDERPRVTRGFVVAPDYTIAWEMDRVIFNGKVKESEQLYALKLNNDLLRKKEPERSKFEPPPKGEDPKAGIERRKRLAEAQAKYNEEMRNYTELRKRVNDAPRDFQADLPVRVWAVFDIRSNAEDLEFTGPQPLPWSITLMQLDAVRGLAKQRVTVQPGESVPREVLGHLGQVKALVQNGEHPWSLRAAAYSLSGSGLLALSRPGDDVATLAQKVLDGPDAKARLLLVEGLAQVNPPSQASLTLLKHAAQNPDADTQAAALASILKVQTNDPELLTIVVDTTNKVLAAPDAPAPAQLLAGILEATRSRADLADAMRSRASFVIKDNARRQAVLRAVIAAAPAETVAAAWLDERLLGGDDTALVKETLGLLGKVVIVPMDASGAATGAASLGYQPPPGVTLPGSFTGAALPTSGGADAVPADALVLDKPIVVAASTHHLINLIASKDEAIRQAAWPALAAFALSEQVPPPDPANPTPDLYQAVVDAGLGKEATPQSLVPFLKRQPSKPHATRSLVSVVLQGDDKASKAAVEALTGSGLPIDTAMRDLTPAQRQQFGQKVYRANGMDQTLVANLLALNVQDNTLATWFAQKVSAGQVPDAAGWAQGVGNEQSLMAYIASGDPELAKGAAAALVASAGGDDAMADAFVRRIYGQTNRAPEYAQQQWTLLRKEINLKRLNAAAGAYRLIVRIYATVPGGITAIDPHMPPPPHGGDPAMPQGTPVAKPASEDVVGTVQLQVDNNTVRFANEALTISLPDTHLAIRIDKPAELKNLPNDAVARMTWDQVATPIDLYPQNDGSWRGQASFPDGRMAELVLEPVKK